MNGLASSNYVSHDSSITLKKLLLKQQINLKAQKSDGIFCMIITMLLMSFLL